MTRHRDFARQAIWIFLIAFALVVPQSIAAAQAFVALALISWAIARVTSGRPGWGRTPLEIPVLAFVSVALASAFWGADRRVGLKGFSTYGLILIVYLVSYNIRDLRKLRWLILALLAGATASSLVKISQAVIVGRLTAGRGEFWPVMTSLGSMSESGQLLIVMGLTVPLARGERNPGRLLLLGGAFALMGVAEILNLKRGAWMGVFCVMAALAWLRAKKLLLVVVAAAVTIVLFYEPVWNRVVSLREEFSVDRGGRLAMWKTVPAIMRDYPLGVGIDNAGIMHRYNPRIERKRDHMHNTYIQLFVEMGPLGLAFFIWWIATFLKMAGHCLRKTSNADLFADAVMVGAVSILVGFLVNGLVEFNFGDSEVAMMLYLVMGAVLVVRRWLQEYGGGLAPGACT